ncbi:lasso RiPP family leader peptide-containing protein [Microbacterium sp. MPKO10]|nr:lasso RiPP family leader peptide-containing protein [Microbacterium sp. MPKO10]MCW4458856.1 lasso RiPP family leader peptide-containing protein [Microbacterium sp. MPKO10]
MAYEAPTITEVGRFSDITLGAIAPLDWDDSTYFWGASSSPAGSR